MLKNLKKIVALGKIAFDSCLKLFNLKKKNFKFYHGARYHIRTILRIICKLSSQSKKCEYQKTRSRQNGKTT